MALTRADFTAENVEKGVNNFYCNVGLQQEVHHWLTSAQISQQAWSFSWQLLTPEKNVQVQYFGASCLHVKISRYWNEVPLDQYESLKTNLLEHIVTFANGPKLILTRLCVALASLALQTMPNAWPTPLESLITMFQEETTALNSSQRCTVLLEILTVFPEEFFTINLTNQRRGILRHELNKSLPKILDLLSLLMSPNSPDGVYIQALKCFASWMEFGVPLSEAEKVVIQVFQSLSNPDVFDSAVDTLVKIFSSPETYKYPNTLQKLLPFILQLQDILTRAISDHDVDVCQGITQIVVSVAENHTKFILDTACGEDENKKSDVLKLVQLALACSCIPGHFPTDETCSSLTFTFWYTLQDNLLELDVDKYHVLLPLFQPIYLSLIENLLVKVQFPSDEIYDTWSAEEKEQFRCYRQDIGDTMMYAYSILREPLLGHLCNALSSIIQNNKEVDIRWQLMEAIFFLFMSVAESVALEENLYLPALLDLLPKIQFTNIKFISTALQMLGSFGEWMNYHPESLAQAVPLLLQGLGNPEVAVAATMALKDVTRETLDHIEPYIQQILQGCQSALESGNLKSRETIRTMSIVGQVLSGLDFTTIMDNLTPILTPHIQELEQLSKQQPSATVKNAILLKLNMLSWLFASLDTEKETAQDRPSKPKQQGPKPVFVVLQQIAPILQAVVSMWISDAGVVEALCELFKRSLQTLMDDFAPLSKDVAELLAQMYQAVPHIGILDLTKQLIIMFHADQEFSSVVQGLLTSICRKTIDLFQGDVQQQTDIVEGFMALLAQILKKTKRMLLQPENNLSAIFQAGIVGMSLPENHTVKACSMFLIEFLNQTEEVAVKDIVVAQGHMLLDRLVRAIGGESPRLIIEHVADVLFCLSKHYSEHLRIWSQEIISKDGYPCVRCTYEEKEQFFKSVLRERANKRRVRELTKELTLLCRGLLGTEYAAQMAELM